MFLILYIVKTIGNVEYKASKGIFFWAIQACYVDVAGGSTPNGQYAYIWVEYILFQKKSSNIYQSDTAFCDILMKTVKVGF